MKVTRIKTAHIGGSATCIKIETDEGISGYGEPSVETYPESVLKLVERFGKEYLIGKDPFQLERHRRVMQDSVWYYSGYTVKAALTGIENALWDIKGRALGVPVYELLGGAVRDRVRIYKWIGASDRSQLAEEALKRKEEGYTGIKFSPTRNSPATYPRMVAEAVELVDQVRSAIGAEMDIMLDPASRWKLAEAKHVLKALEPYNLLFAEDFTTDPTPDILEKLSSSTFIPIAAGDRFSGFKDFEDLIYRNCVAVIQPDICHSGGISELKAIARMAENHGIRIAPHNPQGPLATAAAVHLDLTVPNFLIQEIAGTDFFGAWSHDSLFSMDDYAIAEGSIQSPQKPGFGVEVSDDLFDREWEVPPVPRFWDRSDFHVPEW